MNKAKLIEYLSKELDISFEDNQEEVINTSLAWYKGQVDDFHTYTDYSGSNLKTQRTRMTLQMAKTISEKWANLIINPETTIEMENESTQEWLDNKFRELNITNRMNSLTELYFGLGTGATTQYSDSEISKNNYINASNILPIRFENGDIVSAAFISEELIGSELLIYVNIHEKLDNGEYNITNIFLKEKDNGANYENVEVLDNEDNDLIEKQRVSKVKEFQIYKPAIVNNVDIGSAMGLSVFYNAIDELKAVDIAFDTFINEMKYGKITIYVDEQALMTDDEGNPIYNSDQVEYYVLRSNTNSLGESDNSTPFINVSAPDVRIDDFVNGLNEALNLLGRKCGLGDNAFSSKNGTIYTNTTQVISTNSDLYNTRRKHCSIVEQGLIEMVKSLYYLEFDRELNETISVQFDDSIIHDKERELAELQTQLSLGIISDVYFVQQYYDMSEQEAISFIDNQEKLKQRNLVDEVPLESDVNIEEEL